MRVQGSSVMGIEGHIVRSRVSAIHRDGTLTYETAIEFDRPHAIDGDELEPPRPRSASKSAKASDEGDVYVIDTARSVLDKADSRRRGHRAQERLERSINACAGIVARLQPS